MLTNLLHNLIGLEEARRNGRITEAEFTVSQKSFVSMLSTEDEEVCKKNISKYAKDRERLSWDCDEEEVMFIERYFSMTDKELQVLF